MKETDLVKRLRLWRVGTRGPALAKEAADRLERLERDNAFLIRLIRGEGNPDMIDQMEHFLGL